MRTLFNRRSWKILSSILKICLKTWDSFCKQIIRNLNFVLNNWCLLLYESFRFYNPCRRNFFRKIFGNILGNRLRDCWMPTLASGAPLPASLGTNWSTSGLATWSRVPGGTKFTLTKRGAQSEGIWGLCWPNRMGRRILLGKRITWPRRPSLEWTLMDDWLVGLW